MAFDACLIGNEPAIRLGVFVSSFVLIALWELFTPRRVLEIPRRVRWANNLGLAVVNIFFVRVLFPSAAVGMAILASERGVGLLNVFPVSYPLALIFSLLALDVRVFEVVFNAVL